MNNNKLITYSLMEEEKMSTEQKKELSQSQNILEKVMLEFRIRLNKQLYEEKTIRYDVYHNMENYLIKKISILNKY